MLLAADGVENKRIAQRMKMTPEKAAPGGAASSKAASRRLQKDRAARAITARRVNRVVDMTLHGKPANATHWSTRATARAAGISEAQCVPHLARR